MALCCMTTCLLAHKRHTGAILGLDCLVQVPEPVRVTEHGVECHLSAVKSVHTGNCMLAVRDFMLYMFAVECTVELAGEIQVERNSATYAFTGIGSDITGYTCKLDGIILPDCMSWPHHVFWLWCTLLLSHRF